MRQATIAAVMLFTSLLMNGVASGQSCPKGVRYNCVWGCGRHTDLNNDGFCDYSFITKPEVKEPEKAIPRDSVVAAPKDSIITTTNPATPIATEGQQGKIKPEKRATAEPTSGINTGQAQTPATELQPDQPVTTGEMVVIPPQATTFTPAHQDPVYDLILVSAITLGLYFLTWFLYRRNLIKRIHHRKFWNLLLLLTFLVSCLFGLFLVVQINYHIAMSAYGTLLYWHVEIGIAMSLIAVIHILWHLTYFKNMLKKW